ncbi:MAG: hypothetical protein V4457_12875 [Pseudomonadota bacterium]
MVFFYRLLDDKGTVKRGVDGAVIPLDPSNRDRQEYEEWVKEGNTPAPILPMDPISGLSGTAFINRLTFPEQITICTGAQTNAQMLLWMIRLAAALTVSVDDPEVQQGVQSLVGTVLTKDRAVEILTPADPPKQAAAEPVVPV